MANVIAERYMFYECRQQEGESLSEYLQKLRKRAENCSFGAFLEDALRDRYVCGLADEHTRKHLLDIKGLTLTSAVQISLSYERAEERKGNEKSLAVRNEAKLEPAFKVNCRQYSVCDKRHYTYFKPLCLEELCRFKRAFCSYCNTKGHIARSCLKRNKVKSGITIGHLAQNNNTIISPMSQEEEEEEKVERPHSSLFLEHTLQDTNKEQDLEQELYGSNLDANDRLDNEKCPENNNPDTNMTNQPYHVNYAHKSSGRQPPYKIRLMLNRDIITFEIDTGSAITIISEGTYNRCFLHLPLKSTSAIVKTYSKESLSILGKINVNVYCNGQEYAKMRVFVLKGNGANLLGRNWLNVMKLNWNLIINANCADSEKLTIDSERPKPRKATSHRTEYEIDCSTAYYEEKRDLKEKFAHARSRSTAIEEAIRVELQKLREKRILPLPSHIERKSHVVILEKPGSSHS